MMLSNLMERVSLKAIGVQSLDGKLSFPVTSAGENFRLGIPSSFALLGVVAKGQGHCDG